MAVDGRDGSVEARSRDVRDGDLDVGANAAAGARRVKEVRRTMLEIQFRQLGGQKWLLLGDDGNEFESEAEAWPEAQAAADLGIPWGGATFRLVDIGAGEHSDDCSLGLSREHGCDCGADPVVVAERVLLPSAGVAAEGRLYERVMRHGVTTQVVTDGARLEALGQGSLVVEGVFEPKDGES